MYICEKCHDTDSIATGCIKSYKGHNLVLGDYRGYCEICNRYRPLTVCNRYERQRVLRIELKCPTCVMQFNCSRLRQLGPDADKVRLCSMYKKQANVTYFQRKKPTVFTTLLDRMRKNFEG